MVREFHIFKTESEKTTILEETPSTSNAASPGRAWGRVLSGMLDGQGTWHSSGPSSDRLVPHGVREALAYQRLSEGLSSSVPGNARLSLSRATAALGRAREQGQWLQLQGARSGMEEVCQADPWAALE